MSTYRVFSGLVGASLLAMAAQGTVQAQEINTTELPVTGTELIELDSTVAVVPTDESLVVAGEPSAQPMTNAASLNFDASEESIDLAQARRRTRGRVGSSNFVGIGADFGYADDVSFAVISKFGLSQKISIRPSALIGDDFSILVPVTYDFRQVSGDGFQVIPYVGVGGAYSSSDDDDDELQFIVSGGADFPLSRSLTLNAQANLSVFDDSDFGVTVGVGYNFSSSF